MHGLAPALQCHRGLIEVLAFGAAVRLAVALSQVPAVYQDSLVYIELSKGALLRFTALRPNGYPLVLRVLSLGGGDLRRVTAVQHATGLVVGVLVYVLLVRLGVRRWIAVPAVAVVVLDAYSIALEQAILTETFFALFVFASVFLLVVSDRRPVHVVASGLLLAFATITRAAGLWAIPVWIAYVLLLRRGWRLAVVATCAVLLPLVAYCGVRSFKGHALGLTDSDGWLLYSRVAPTLDCRGARIPPETEPLCLGPRGQPQDFYLYVRNSPAQILFFGPTGDVNVDRQFTPDNNRLLRQFAVAVIRAHPQTYLRTVTADLRKYFVPNDPSVELGLLAAPQSPMNRYGQVVRVPWWLIPAASGAALLVYLRREPPTHAREILFVAGTAWALLFGTSTTAAFNLRYAIPLVPLFVCVAAASVDAVWPRERGSPGSYPNVSPG